MVMMGHICKEAVTRQENKGNYSVREPDEVERGVEIGSNRRD